MTKELSYETFVRRAFSIHNKKCPCENERWGDPASLADTDTFHNAITDYRYFAQVKAAVVYSMCIIANRLEEENKDSSLATLAAELIVSAGNETSAITLSQIIKEFVEQVEFIAFPPVK